ITCARTAPTSRTPCKASRTTSRTSRRRRRTSSRRCGRNSSSRNEKNEPGERPGRLEWHHERRQTKTAAAEAGTEEGGQPHAASAAEEVADGEPGGGALRGRERRPAQHGAAQRPGPRRHAAARRVGQALLPDVFADDGEKTSGSK